VAGFVSVTQPFDDEVKQITMTTPIIDNNMQELNPIDFPHHFLHLGTTLLAARLMAVALQENEPGVEGTAWWGPWEDCDDHPKTSELRKLQAPHYTASGNAALAAVIS
jgi:hypothetical protein